MSHVFHVRSWRKKMGLTRKAAAELLGISAHTIKSYELCRRDLSRPIQQLMMKLEQERLQQPKTSHEHVVIVGGAFLDQPHPKTSSENEPSRMIPCYGQTARQIQTLCHAYDIQPQMLWSKVACPNSELEHAQELLDALSEQCGRPQVKMILLPMTTPFGLTYLEQRKGEGYEEVHETPTLMSGKSSLARPLANCISPLFQSTDSSFEPSQNASHPTLSMASWIKQRRPDILVVGFTKEHPQYVQPHGSDYIVCTSSVNKETMHYLLDQNGNVCHSDSDKEVVLARLFELSLERLEEACLEETLEEKIREEEKAND